jgi:hypothetical protein
MVYQVRYGKENVDQNRLQARAAVQSCDSGQVTRKAYCSIASLSLDLPHEWLVASEKQYIMEEMRQIIPIHLISLTDDFNIIRKFIYQIVKLFKMCMNLLEKLHIVIFHKY